MKIQYKLIVIYAVFLASTLPFCASLHGQKLVVVKKYKQYWQEAKNDSLQRMVELKVKVPGILYDLRYATKNNFTGQKLYKNARQTFLRLPAANALKKVQEELKDKGYGLKIFDAYRPYSITVKMWQLVHDERYVADPAKGSGHNRGLAVDLTIIDLHTFRELDMGTGFDNFTDTAHHDFNHLAPEVLKNRTMLKHIMMAHGFNAFDTEWWHYSWPNDQDYKVLDLTFRQLNKGEYDQ